MQTTKCPEGRCGPVEDASDEPNLFPPELLDSDIPRHQLGVCTRCGTFYHWNVAHQRWEELMAGNITHVHISRLRGGGVPLPTPLEEEGWVLGRWWRVMTPKGELWCETSVESEARDSMKKKPNCTLYKMLRKEERMWVVVDDD